METKIKNVSVPELPNETWLEIMSYLSTYDVLRNVARVSKRIHKLSEDPHVIRKIEVETVQSWLWPKDKKYRRSFYMSPILQETQREKYCSDFLGVLKRSLKLKTLSFGFGWDVKDKSEENFLEALSSMDHPLLQEFCLKGDGNINNSARFLDLNPLNENIPKYLEKCSDLKVLKFEFKPEWNEDPEANYPSLDDMKEGIKRFKLKNLQEFHLIGVCITECDLDDFLETIAKNLPKLQRLFLTCCEEDDLDSEMFQAFASGKNIKLEISSVNRHREIVNVLNF